MNHIHTMECVRFSELGTGATFFTLLCSNLYDRVGCLYDEKADLISKNYIEHVN